MKKFFAIILCTMFGVLLNGTDVLVAKMNVEMIGNQDQADNSLLRADSIEYRYRLNNGRMQYRRWSLTRNCWTDLKWVYI